MAANLEKKAFKRPVPVDSSASPPPAKNAKHVSEGFTSGYYSEVSSAQKDKVSTPKKKASKRPVPLDFSDSFRPTTSSSAFSTHGGPPPAKSGKVTDDDGFTSGYYSDTSVASSSSDVSTPYARKKPKKDGLTAWRESISQRSVVNKCYGGNRKDSNIGRNSYNCTRAVNYEKNAQGVSFGFTDYNIEDEPKVDNYGRSYEISPYVDAERKERCMRYYYKDAEKFYAAYGMECPLITHLKPCHLASKHVETKEEVDAGARLSPHIGFNWDMPETWDESIEWSNQIVSSITAKFPQWPTRADMFVLGSYPSHDGFMNEFIIFFLRQEAMRRFEIKELRKAGLPVDEALRRQVTQVSHFLGLGNKSLLLTKTKQ